MSGTREGIAGYLRTRREAFGLTRAELARRAGVSEALLQKIEQGTRSPTAGALGPLFDALEVPDQFREHAAGLLQPELAVEPPDGPLEPGELEFLHSLPYPACYQTMPAVDVVAANTAYLRAFPGLVPGGNIMEWMLLDPAARIAIEGWERETHLIVYGFRHMGPGLLPAERYAELVRTCSASPDWERLWSTDIAPAEIPRRPVRVRCPDTGAWIPMRIQVFRFEVPRRPWWMYTLTPIPMAEAWS